MVTTTAILSKDAGLNTFKALGSVLKSNEGDPYVVKVKKKKLLLFVVTLMQ